MEYRCIFCWNRTSVVKWSCALKCHGQYRPRVTGFVSGRKSSEEETPCNSLTLFPIPRHAKAAKALGRFRAWGHGQGAALRTENGTWESNAGMLTCKTRTPIHTHAHTHTDTGDRDRTHTHSHTHTHHVLNANDSTWTFQGNRGIGTVSVDRWRSCALRITSWYTSHTQAKNQLHWWISISYITL